MEAKNETELPSELRTDALAEAWSDYCENRKQMRKKVTPKCAELNFKKFARWGPVKSVLAIHMSIENGWTGIFEPKGIKNVAQVNGAGRIYQSDETTRAKMVRETAILKLFNDMEPTEQDCLLAEFRRLSPKNEFASHVHRAFREWAYEQKMAAR